jgi:hypothetical protein
VNTLIDSGCTGVGCIDRFLVAELQLCCERLPQPQPLCLADSAVSSFLTYFVIIRVVHQSTATPPVPGGRGVAGRPPEPCGRGATGLQVAWNGNGMARGG